MSRGERYIVANSRNIETYLGSLNVFLSARHPTGFEVSRFERDNPLSSELSARYQVPMYVGKYELHTWQFMQVVDAYLKPIKLGTSNITVGVSFSVSLRLGSIGGSTCLNLKPQITRLIRSVNQSPAVSLRQQRQQYVHIVITYVHKARGKKALTYAARNPLTLSINNNKAGGPSLGNSP